MSNSSLVSYTKISPNKTSPRTKKIDAIVIHHMAGNCSVETCGSIFANPSRKASSNYGVGTDGRIAMYVEEKDRSWCSSSGVIDHRAITIEVANYKGEPNWEVSDKALESLIALCTDICKRNGIAKLNYTGDKSGNLHMHKWYAATGCPGPYLGSKFSYIAEEVNKRLNSTSKTTTKTTTTTTTTKTSTSSELPSRGYFMYGDNDARIGKIAAFMRKVFPSYTPAAALGNYFGPNLLKAVKEFQKRTGLGVDGYIGPKTLAKLKSYGFKY